MARSSRPAIATVLFQLVMLLEICALCMPDFALCFCRFVPVRWGLDVMFTFLTQRVHIRSLAIEDWNCPKLNQCL